MRSISLLSLFLVVLAAGASDAAERKLAADEIAAALTGNTVEGLWGETPYKSYFDPGGFTIYQPEGGRPDRGKWRADRDSDRYCSHWERSGWSCYDVYQDGDQIIWVQPSDGKRYPSTLLMGDQL